MNHTTSAPRQERSAAYGRSAAAGFTLVEVMVASFLLTMAILSILAVLIASYQLGAKARYRDHARYVVKSFADQFLTQQTTDGNANTLQMFLTTPGTSGNAGQPTGVGLTWTDTLGNTTVGTSNGLTVPLGDTTGATINATVTRNVRYVDPTGTPTLLAQNQSAGYMLEGDFTITFTYLNAQVPLTVTAIRSVP